MLLDPPWLMYYAVKLSDPAAERRRHALRDDAREAGMTNACPTWGHLERESVRVSFFLQRVAAYDWLAYFFF